MPLPLAMGVGLGLKALGGLFGRRGQKKKDEAANLLRKQQVTAKRRQAEIGVQAGEDTRLARLQMAQALLGGVPGQTAGGRVNTNTQIDPATLQALGVRRNYDFSEAFAPEAPEAGAGAGSSFLGGLAGDLGGAALDYGLGKPQGSPVGGFGGESEFDPSAIPGLGGALSQDDVKKAYGG